MIKIGVLINSQTTVKSGLVTGAIITPTLFNVYVNSINHIGIKANLLQ